MSSFYGTRGFSNARFPLKTKSIRIDRSHFFTRGALGCFLRIRRRPTPYTRLLSIVIYISCVCIHLYYAYNRNIITTNRMKHDRFYIIKSVLLLAFFLNKMYTFQIISQRPRSEFASQRSGTCGL